MGLSESEYRNRQMATLRQMVATQNSEAKDRLSDTSLSLRTSWQKDRSVHYQMRPARDEKKEQEDALKRVAEAGRVADDDYLGDVSAFLAKGRQQQDVKQTKEQVIQESVAEVIPMEARQQVHGRNVDVPTQFHTNMESNDSYQQMVAELKQAGQQDIKRATSAQNKIREFLKPDDWLLFSKFIIVKSYDDYMKKVRDKIKLSEITGVYLIANVTKGKMYVGKGSKAIEKCGQHFRRRVGSTDSVPEIREDLLLEDTIGVNFVKLKDTDFDTIEELSEYYIKKYDCRVPKGYNKRLVTPAI